MYGLELTRAPLYTRDISLLRQYGGSGYKLVRLNVIRNKGVECDKVVPKNSVNTEKLSNNLTRARTNVREIGLCNDWQYFTTLTLNGEKHSRYNLKEAHKAIVQFFADLRKKHGITLKFLLIPEKHKDGAWHFHGLLSGIPSNMLTAFNIQQHLPIAILQKLSSGQQVYTWQAYADKFGYCTIEPLRDKDRAVSYILKYISKDLERSVCDLGAHLYYASKGLNKSTILKKGKLVHEIAFDFSNEYCDIRNFTADADIEKVKNLIVSPYDKLEETYLI